jgi:hypothetical protein
MPPMPASRAPWTIGLAGAGAIGAVLFILVAMGPLDIVDLVAPGRLGSGGEVMVQDFGAEAIPDRYSYDGQTVYLGARELPDLDAAIAAVPGPDYRLRRILLPLLASPGGTGDTIIVLIALWSVVGVGLGTWGLACLAAAHGRDPRLGYAVAVAFAFPTVVGTNDALAFGLGIAGLALAGKHQLRWASLALALGGLARESALIMAIALVLDLVWQRRFRAAMGVAVASAAPLLVWNQVLQARVPPAAEASTELLGIVHLAQLDPIDFAMSGAVLALMLVAIGTWRDVRLLLLVGLGYLGACALYIVDTFRWHALMRVSAPAVALGLAGLAWTVSEPVRRSVGRTDG